MGNLEILYSDKHLLACIKPSGINSEDELIAVLKEQLGGEFYSVHRLDKPVSGVIVFARNAQAAAKMTAAVSGREVKKEYLAVVSGRLEEEQGVFSDLLFYDRSKAKSYVVKRERKGVKEASLDYSVLQSVNCEGNNYSLVQINLRTGRTHQIRVQFGSRRHPVIGDARYGSDIKLSQIALISHRLEFTHPYSGKTISLISRIPDTYPWTIFGAALTETISEV